MVMIRPSLTLIIDLDERSAQQETILEIKRSYTHISVPLIRTHREENDKPLTNTIRLVVGLGASDYLHSSTTGADEKWNTIIEPWLGNMLHKVGNNMHVFNDRQRSINLPELIFNYFEIVLQNGAFTVCLHPDAQCNMAADLNALIGKARTLFNQEILSGAVRITAPSNDSYNRQHAEAWECWIQEHPESPEAPQTETTTEQKIPEPEKTYEEKMQEDIIAKSYENTAVPATDSPALPSPDQEDKEEAERYNFAVDYSLWEVEFQDGSTRVFNSLSNQFIN